MKLNIVEVEWRAHAIVSSLQRCTKCIICPITRTPVKRM